MKVLKIRIVYAFLISEIFIYSSFFLVIIEFLIMDLHIYGLPFEKFEKLTLKITHIQKMNSEFSLFNLLTAMEKINFDKYYFLYSNKLIKHKFEKLCSKI